MEREGGRGYSLGGVCLRLSDVGKHATSEPCFIVAVGLQVALTKHKLRVGKLSVFTFTESGACTGIIKNKVLLRTKYIYKHSVQFT